MQNQNNQMTHKQAETKAVLLLNKMTLEEKIAMVGGNRAFFIRAIERLGISEVAMTDASMGVNIRDIWDGNEINTDLEKSVAYPCLLQLASTWNISLSDAYARSVGEECRAAGIAILLGPGMNIYRHSQCGRNFEYLGEDPFLASQFIAKYVKGLQSTGVAATLKHFLANNTDYFRRKSNSVVDSRTLHEIYLPAFQAGIDAGAKVVMTAYNLFNGEWCGQSKEVVTDLLRDEMGFQWLVMTDWWSIYDCEKSVKSGQDLEMPGALIFKEIPRLLEEGKISESDIDRMVLNIVKTSLSMDFYNPDFQNKELLSLFSEHEDVALKTAREGIVLLKNENNLLPLDTSSGKNILLTGKFVEEPAFAGGAAKVKGYDWITLLDGCKKEFGESVLYIQDPTDDNIREADIVLLSTGTLDSEGCDRSFDLPSSEEAKINKILSLNSRTVVIVSSGGGINMANWVDKVGAILYSWYGGQLGNRALAEILSGKVNPSGKLPITIERDFSESPGGDYLPEGEELYSGWNDEKEKVYPVYDVPYNEGILVGYRWYEKKNISPLFSFGHGLSYTSFEYSDINLSTSSESGNFLKNGETARTVDFSNKNKDENVIVNLTVKNTGYSEGMEVVQLYIRDVESTVLRPEKELKGFKKVSLLPGEVKTVQISLSCRDFSYWCEDKNEWYLESGDFEIVVGSASDNILLRSTITVKDLE